MGKPAVYVLLGFLFVKSSTGIIICITHEPELMQWASAALCMQWVLTGEECTVCFAAPNFICKRKVWISEKVLVPPMARMRIAILTLKKETLTVDHKVRQ